jgi:hypothetical protein
MFEETPRTRVIRSRLHLLGILGEGQMTAADDLPPVLAVHAPDALPGV